MGGGNYRRLPLWMIVDNIHFRKKKKQNKVHSEMTLRMYPSVHKGKARSPGKINANTRQIVLSIPYFSGQSGDNITYTTRSRRFSFVDCNTQADYRVALVDYKKTIKGCYLFSIFFLRPSSLTPKKTKYF